MSKGPLVGTLLAERFRIVDLLGEGAMGEVYVAEHEALGRKVAVKILHESVEHDERLVERFRREARAASHLDHPNIVGITDFGRTEEDQLYLVMEYIPGVSLQEAIEEVEPARMPFRRVVSILTQISGAVQAAHDAGVVHRDLKPDNILLGKGRDGLDLVKILDFGLAKMMQAPELSRLTRKGEIFGTPAYMSPEQARGDSVDHRADIYSVAVMAYELLSGRLPFVYNTIPRLLIAHQQEPPTPPSTHVPPGEWPIPGELEALIMRSLEKAPDARPGSLAELQALLAAQHKRMARTPSRIIPQVLINQVTQVTKNPLSDWCEVTLEHTSSDAVGATLLGDDLLVEEVEEGILLEELPADGGVPAGAPAQWYWSRIVTKAKALAQHLRDQRLGTIELSKALGELANLEERTTSLETEIALARSRMDETEGITHEAESRLRFAVMDLSMERGRLIDEHDAPPDVIHDLDFQIRALEGRLAEVHRERAKKIAGLEEAIGARQQHVEHYRKVQTDAEAGLMNLLHRVRPNPCPDDLDEGYQRLEQLLRAMQTAQG